MPEKARLLRERLQTTRLLLIVPALYLGVHLFFQVRDYHPRAILIGYFSMGAIAMLAIRERAAVQRFTGGRFTGGFAARPS